MLSKFMKAKPDSGHENAFTPSPLSLRLFTVDQTNLQDVGYPDRYQGGRWKILVVGSDQQYLKMANGTYFSTGNHPVETLVPMYHLEEAGFGFDVATLSGGPVKFEHWAMPSKDEIIQRFYQKHLDRFYRPLELATVVAKKLGPDNDYVGVFIPGGHGALMGLPNSAAMRSVLEWAAEQDKFIISLCHGPAAFLALGDANPFRGKKICAFSDFVDTHTPRIGYMPGKLTWKFGERLTAQGFRILNKLVTGATCMDGKMLTGDSPLASDALGKLAGRELLKHVQHFG